MALVDDLTASVIDTLNAPWDIRTGYVVPTTETVALRGGGVEIDATILYADLAQSSKLATEFDRRTGAKVIKAFLGCAVKLIRANAGDITSFDGDRVMAIFLGDGRNDRAAKCALQIEWVMVHVLRPKLTEYFSSLRTAGFQVSHATGVDASRVLAVRAGARGNNDLVWIGRAPNLAAKMSDLRENGYTSYVSGEVYSGMSNATKIGGSPPRAMWEQRTLPWHGETLIVYRSNWWWKP